MMNRQFVTTCVCADAEDINLMVDNEQEIEYPEFLDEVRVHDLKQLFPDYDWTDFEGKPGFGFTLGEDYAVSFHKSEFCGEPCIYLVHSAIEYVFI